MNSHTLTTGLRINVFDATKFDQPFDLVIATESQRIDDIRIPLNVDEVELLGEIARHAVAGFRDQLQRASSGDLFDDLNDLAAEHDAAMTRGPLLDGGLDEHGDPIRDYPRAIDEHGEPLK